MSHGPNLGEPGVLPSLPVRAELVTILVQSTFLRCVGIPDGNDSVQQLFANHEGHGIE